MGNTICPPLDKKVYSELLEKCLKHLGVTVNYSILGGGECGQAFLASGKIYKITTDKSEAIESNKLVGKKNKHLADIYMVKKIENPYTNQEVFLIVLEPLNTNRNSMFASLQEGLIEILESKTGEHFLDLIHYYRFEPNIYKEQFEEEINKALAPHQEVMFYYYSLLHIVDELAANNIQSLDLQYRNLGMKPNGNIAFFDLGYGDNKGQVSSMQINEGSLEEDISDIDKILNNQNVDQLTFAKNIAHKLGYNSDVNLLGVGTQGFAADIGHNLVLKVTSDHSEAAEASRLLGRKNNYIGNFYKIYQISEPYTNMYAIIREKLDVNPDKVRIILISTRDFVRRLGVKTPTNFAYFLRDLVVEKDIESLSTLIEAANNIQDQIEKKNVMNVLYMIDEMISRDMLTGDFISSNLGFKANGVLAYYDVGLSDRTVAGGFPTLTLEDEQVTDNFVLTDKEEPIFGTDEYGDKTKEVIGRKPYKEFRYTDSLGGEAFGRIEDHPKYGHIGRIVGMNSVPSQERYGSRVEEFKKRGFFKAIINKLKEHGVKTLFIGLQSNDTRNAVQRLLATNVLSNPRGMTGPSDMEHPTLFDINERELKYMKNASLVGVDKKCTINGNGDGTSTACNQGEIKNIKLSKLNEGQKTKIEYGAVMLMFDIKKWDEITDIIEKDDIYDKPTFGIEKEPHVTILYGLHNDVTLEQVKEKLNKISENLDEEIEVELIGISHFETPSYDVVKFDAKTEELTKMNKVLKELPFTSNFPEYHPHMSISYVKKGTGKKYNVKFDEPIKLSSNKIVYSLVKGTKFTLNEHTGRWARRFNKKIGIKDTKIEETMTENLVVGLNELPFKADVEAAGGKLYSVGGAVRDSILGKDSKDLDILVTGIPLDTLEQILTKYGKVDSVGKSFGIIKFNSPKTGEIDIAIPRTEKKNDAGGYQGFDVTSDHSLPIEKDLERRDFTINAIAKDSNGLMIDPYGGQSDIQSKQIKMVNPQAFSDDPLRMLRAIQFASRFGFSIEPETMKAIQQNANKIAEISPERILIEFDKIVKKGQPMIGAKLLRQTGLYNYIFGVNRGINLAEFKNVKTMGEFIFGLTHGNLQSPSEFFKNNMKGDLDTYNNIKALEIGEKTPNQMKTIFDMYKVYPKSLETAMLGNEFTKIVNYMKQNNIPFSLKEIPVNGNDLMNLGFQGKAIGDTFVLVLNQIYSGKLKNDREDILAFVKTLMK